MKKTLLVLLLILSLLMLFACGGSGGTEGGDDEGSTEGGDTPGNEGGGDSTGGGDTEKKYRVTLLTSDGVTVTSQNPLEVTKGGTATFNITLGATYVLVAPEGAEYDAERGVITVSNVQRDVRITLTATYVGYDTTESYIFSYEGLSELDVASHESGASVSAGSTVSVSALDESRIFMGWSVGGYITDGGSVVSEEREYSVVLTPDTVTDGEYKLYANYSTKEDNVVYYYLNGGSVAANTPNLTNNTYYSFAVETDRVKVTLSDKYFSKAGTPSLFWNDGSFYREGYVLKEYNTRPDGSGESYDPGSLYPVKTRGSAVFCIWAKESEHSDFEYESVHYGYATGTDATKAPHWKQDGIKITNYKGDADEVVIPETIDGKYVTAIAADAFRNKKMKTLIMSRFLLNVADGAFVNCSSLRTVYYPDSIFVISDAAFDTASWAGVENFYVSATMAPRKMSGRSDCGVYAIKLARFLANPDKKRITVVSGSSSFQGLSGGYLEALLGDEYCAVNFGTTRTTHIFLFLPVLGYYANENDVIIYAPENSIYEMGEPAFYWKTLRDAEGMYNIFRHIDISNYTNVISSFSDFNRGLNGSYNRYASAPQRYEQMIDNTNDWGEYDHNNRHQYMQENLYSYSYDIRLDKFFVGAKSGLADITEAKYKDNMNDAIERAKVNGALVYYSFAPMADADINVDAKAGGDAWYQAFEKLIEDNFVFDGVLGDAKNYIFNVAYFYDNAYHPNDYGRVYRTYRVYMDLCTEILGIPESEWTDYYCDAKMDNQYRLVDSKGNVLFRGCMFEIGSRGLPTKKADA